MRHTSYLYTLLVATVVVLGSCSKFSKLQKNGTLDQKYEAALAYYKKAEYYKAGVLFEEIIPQLNGKDAHQAELAQFYNAYSNYKQSNYNMAQFLFKSFYETFQRSDYAQEALYMHAYSLYKDSPHYELDQTSTLTAIAAMQDFINTYPDSPFRAEGTQIILELRDKLERKAYEKAKLYYKTSEANMANYRSAVVAINNYQKDFPDSKYNEELAYLRVDAQYNLAKLSYKSKQKERYQDVLKYYLALVDKYPDSKYIKTLEKYYTNSQKALEDIEKDENPAVNTGKLSTPSSTQK